MAQGSDTFSELSQYTLDRRAMRLLPEPFYRRHSVVVLGKIDAQAADAPVPIGMADPDNQALRFRISDFLQRPIQPVKLNRYELESALRTGFGAGAHTKSDLVINKRPPSRQPPTPVQLRRHARAHGFRTLVEDALEKIASGQTTLAELVRVIPYRQIMAAREDRQRGQGTSQDNKG